jgi:SAM-dependent methyltransferase
MKKVAKPNDVPRSKGAAATETAIGHSLHGAERLVCPVCAVPLEGSDARLHCPQCRESWPVINGVPHFVEDFPYWGEIPLEQMREVNRTAAAGSWEAALRDSPEPSVQKASEMILNLDRANWHCLVNLPPESRVLDLGAGTGTNSHALAMRYREVVALEPVRERIQFMQQRFSQEGLSNITIVRSSLWTLPFAKESFDLVAMNGVLEWVAEGRDGDPEDLQERALRQAFELLRPGGYLYLGIENRMALGYFIGYPDPHSGTPFVTILPRRLAHWYARKNGHSNGYRNYLYSSRGYRKLLQKVGFTRIDVNLALPSYNQPRFLIPLEGGGYSYYTRNFNATPSDWVRRTLREILLKLDVLKYCEYSFAILAGK